MAEHDHRVNMPIDRATGELVEPIGYQGTGVDWEVYSNERPMRAVGYIGGMSVAEVRARSRALLFIKMTVAGHPHRHTPQAAPEATS